MSQSFIPFRTNCSPRNSSILCALPAQTIGLRAGRILSYSFVWLSLGLLSVQTGCLREQDFSGGSQVKDGSLGQESTTRAIEGTWAKLSVFTSKSSALGVTTKTSIGRYSLLQLSSQSDQGWAARETLCEIKTVASGSTSITFPDRLVESIGPNTYNYQFSDESVSMPQAVDLMGVRLNDRLTDPLVPASSYDQDGDGSLGVSVNVSAKVLFSSLEGQLFIMQRTIWSEQGRWESPSRIKGTIAWKGEQKTLGSTNRLLSAVTPTITSLPDESPFYLVKLSDGSDCEEIKALQGQDLPNL